MLDSLVRVPRRVAQSHFTNIKKTVGTTPHRDERTPPLVSQIEKHARHAGSERYPTQKHPAL